MVPANCIGNNLANEKKASGGLLWELIARLQYRDLRWNVGRVLSVYRHVLPL